MVDISNAITNTISITNFNRGQAGQIFDSVRKTGAKIVIKNNKPECVLLSPEDYLSLMDELNNARLLAIANERLANFNGNTLSQEEMSNILGLTQNDLAGFENVEIE